MLLKGSDRRYAFTEAASGAAGIRAVQQYAAAQHRCIVLDYNLPDMTAAAFLAAISGSEGTPDWPVVVFTGGDSAEASRSSLRAGAHDYVGKSWMTPQVLVRAVENASERWAMARELQQQTTAAQTSEQHFRALAQATSDIVYRMSADWSVMHPLDGRALVASTDTPLAGWAWLDRYIPAEEHARVRQAIGMAISQKALFSLEHRVLRPDGSIGWTASRAVPLLDENKNVVVWFGAASDITQRKAYEEALARSKRELQTLADNTPDILVRFDRQLRHVFVNATAERVTGLAPAEFLGKTNRDLGMPIELCDMWDAAIAAVFDKGHAVSREFSYDAATGARHFHSTLIPERGPTGEVVNVLGVTRDRTEEKQAQDALRMAGRRKDEFLATLAHELRNPLAPIRTGLQVLRLAKDPATAQRTQLMMERQLGHMVRLIDDLLDVSRITSGKVVLRLERIELQTAVHTAIEAVRPLLDAAGQMLRIDIPTEPIWLQADFTRISQVVNNLLTNAAKYSPHGSSIALSVERGSGDAVVTVADRGEGIPQNMLGHIFEMFAQVDRTLDRAQGGLGIGLALVKRLVEMHGGTVSAKSAGLGTGSTFTLRLPAFGVTESLDSPVAPLKQAATHTSLRLLVVDDNVDAAESLAQLLSLYGHETRVADSGLSSLAIVREFRPALVFLDIGMPGMSGYETARRIRADDPLGSVTLVALTGWGAEADRIKAREAGFDHHFTKPLELGKVEGVLQQVALRQAGARSASSAKP